MKKTLLATAIAGAMVFGASAAQAAVVYDQDGTQLILNGRIALGIQGGGPEQVGTDADGNPTVVSNSAEMMNLFSRMGLSMSQQIDPDLRAFGRVEWRFTGNERDTTSGFSEVRHSFIGLESSAFGTVMAGNYDSFYNSQVMGPFDVYLNRGLEFSRGQAGQLHARGNSIGYMTPDLQGFKAFISAKHHSDRGDVEPTVGSETVTQGGVSYEQGPLRLALGYVDDSDVDGRGRTPGNNETLWGGTVSFAVNDQFSTRLGYETRSDNDELGGGFDTWGLGMTYAMGPMAFNADVYRVSPDNADNRTAWAAGAYYKLSSNFDVLLELHQADQPDITISTADGIDVADGDDVYWLIGARYHF